MTEHTWMHLVGQSVCITTNGETICGVVTEIMPHPDPCVPYLQAVMDDGWAISLREDTTWEPDHAP